ncbi:E3 ubiquitin-protein ligase [Vairimorpha necatrix]|uniref:HECT-type E3 ubiquitin transferase n=1 Tax=Vairimorpha necatrix TaxID=6039 RepID=A0AAX4JB31_9MICR
MNAIVFAKILLAFALTGLLFFLLQLFKYYIRELKQHNDARDNDCEMFLKEKRFYQEIKSKYPTTQSKKFKIYVDRNNVLKSSFDQIMKLRSSDLLPNNNIIISFKNEEGIDQGAITREWITLILSIIFSPEIKLFYSPGDDVTKMIPGCTHVTNVDKLIYYRFLGRILGRMLVSKVNANVSFHEIVWKHMLEIPINMSDFEKLDLVLYKNLLSLREHSENLQELKLTFEIEDVELIQNGKNIIVDESNLDLYIEEYLKHKYISKIKIQCDEIKLGINDVIPGGLINKFTYDHLKSLFCGLDNIDVADWIKNTRYDGFTINDQIIIWFWEIIKNFTEDEKKLLLHFVTGSNRLPMRGFRDLSGSGVYLGRFTIRKIESDNDKKFPIVKSCLNMLLLPEYSSKEVLKEKILYAIHNCAEGFALR